MRKSARVGVVWFACVGISGCAHGVEFDLGAFERGGGGGGFGPAGSTGAGFGGSSVGSGGFTSSSVSSGSSGATGGAGVTGSGGAGGSGGSSTSSAAATSSSAVTSSSAATSSGAGGATGGAGIGGAGGVADASTDVGGTGGSIGGSGGGARDDGGSGPVIDAAEEPPPPVCPECPLRVQYQCFQNGDSVSQLELGLIVKNASTAAIPLNTISLRYWYTADGTGTQQATRVGSDTAVTLNVRRFAPAKVNADAYIEVVLSGPGTLAPGADSGPIRISLRATTQPLIFDQTDDHSFRSTGASYLETTNVTAYQGTRLVWGTEPQ